MYRRLVNARVQTKIILVLVLAFLGMVGLLGAAMHYLWSAQMEGRSIKTKHIVEVAHSLLAAFDARVAAGELTRDEAQRQALAAFRFLKYGDNEYIWINDATGRVIAHRVKPALEGKDVSGLKDPTGKFYMREMLEAASKGGGLVYYLWEKPGHDNPVRKVSYMKMYEPWGWDIGSGVYLDDIEADFRATAIAFGSIALLVVALVVLVSIVVVRLIVRPLDHATAALDRLAEGDYAADLTDADRRDEIGRIMQSVAIFREKLQQAEDLRRHQDSERDAREARSRRVEALTRDFDGTVSQSLGAMGDAAGRMQATAGSMSVTVEQTVKSATSVASAAEQAAANVQTVASAASQLSASIVEIGRQVASSVEIATEAVVEAERTDTLVRGLSEAAARIGDVVNLINDIASQTNLLALNATIEAARAGEAGKGFAVVASEVKNLASQTARATEEIGQQITAVQAATRDAVTAIQGIGSTIERISGISTAIASAVEEQGAATGEIARNVQEASAGTQEVTTTIGHITEAAGRTGGAATDVLSASGHLSREAEALRGCVQRFLDDVRTA